MSRDWPLANPETTHPAIFGLEHEVPIYEVLQANGRGPVRKMHQIWGAHLNAFFDGFIHARYPRAGRWFQYGDAVLDGRIYPDVGQLELSTAECMNPFELATRMSSMRDELRSYLLALKGGYIAYCDSAGLEWSTSFHENYYSSLVRVQLTGLTDFLTSRIVLTGTGGPTVRDFYENEYFCLSPRLVRTSDLLEVKETDIEGMARVHVRSSDQIMSPATIALQAGITAFAIRLHEQGVLPQMPLWFDGTTLNRHVPGRAHEVFIQAVCFQRQVYDQAREYAQMCNEKGFPSIFGDEDSLEYFFTLWDHRLELLEQYCKDWNVLPLAEEFEWAAKAELVFSLRDRDSRDNRAPMTSKEMWLCSEFTSFIPATKKIEQLQRPFLYCDDSYRDVFLVPRAAARAQVLQLATQCDAESLLEYVDWDKVKVQYMEGIALPTPFDGLTGIDPSDLLPPNRPFDFSRIMTDARVVRDTTSHIEPTLILR